jgi:hypothetical protein
MLVDVLFEKQYSAYVCVEVPDDATTEEVEPAANQKLQEKDWQDDYTGMMHINICEPSLSWKVFYVEAP